MKKVASKTSAIIGMTISVLSFALAIGSLIFLYTEEPEHGMGTSFGLWVYSVIVAMTSIPFYIHDALKILIQRKQKMGRWFNVILALLNIGSIPMLLYFGGGYSVVLWNVYYLAMFVMEAISVRALLKRKPMIY